MADPAAAPRPLSAWLLSLLMPGLGHAYGGFPVRGAAFFLLHFFFLAGLVVSGTKPALVAALLLVLRLAIASAAGGSARRSPSPPRRRAALLFYLSGLALGLFLRWLILPAVEVAGESMAPSLRDGDLLLADRFVHRLFPPRAGAVVVADNPGTGPRRLVKRLAAVGPAELALDGRSWEVPAGESFLLGDNRSRGPDSRAFGPVPDSAIRLRLRLVVWSWDRERERVRWERIGRRI